MSPAPTYQQPFEELTPAHRRRALWLACHAALQVWQRLMAAPMDYVDSVVGVHHDVDLGLPARALEEVAARLRGETPDPAQTLFDYREPITALHDEDVEFPVEALYAYYAIYNLHRLVFAAGRVEELLVLNQAISATLSRQDDHREIAQRLADWWERAAPPPA